MDEQKLFVKQELIGSKSCALLTSMFGTSKPFGEVFKINYENVIR